MTPVPAVGLDLQDDECCDAVASVVAVTADAIAFDRTCFYPGGGQPADPSEAYLEDGTVLAIDAAHAAAAGVVWHRSRPAPQPGMVGERATLRADAVRRRTLSRHHTALHALNTIALRDYGALVTGAQIGLDYSRIDFGIEGFSSALAAELEAKANAVLAADRPLSARDVAEEEFRGRGDLARTLEARPPVVDGRVRVVEIAGFDAQACRGTHVRPTAAVGRLTTFRTENKGRINQRFYVRLEPAA